MIIFLALFRAYYLRNITVNVVNIVSVVMIKALANHIIMKYIEAI